MTVELLARTANERGEPGVAFWQARDLLTCGDEERERPGVLVVLARHERQLTIHRGVEAAQAREDGLLLVARVEGQRLGEVAPDAERGLPHGLLLRAARIGDPTGERQELADAIVAREEQADRVLGGGGASEPGQHAPPAPLRKNVRTSPSPSTTLCAANPFSRARSTSGAGTNGVSSW